MDQEWFYTIIDKYLDPKDAVSLRTTSRIALVIDVEKHKLCYFATKIISRTVCRWHAYHKIFIAFIKRCTIDKHYRQQHFDIHNSPRPHICLSSTHRFIENNMFRKQWPILWGRMYPELLNAVLAAENNPDILRVILQQWPDI